MRQWPPRRPRSSMCTLPRGIGAAAEERRGGLLPVGGPADGFRPGEAATAGSGGRAADDGDRHDAGRRGSRRARGAIVARPSAVMPAPAPRSARLRHVARAGAERRDGAAGAAAAIGGHAAAAGGVRQGARGLPRRQGLHGQVVPRTRGASSPEGPTMTNRNPSPADLLSGADLPAWPGRPPSTGSTTCSAPSCSGDVLRRRSQIYYEQRAKALPNVLSFDAELVLDARTFERPANYILVQIKPPAGVRIDPKKRPFVVVDPRAGHGRASAASRPTASWRGDARRPSGLLRRLHPEPMPGQTIETSCTPRRRSSRR